jgi:hypothetical protein
MGNTAVVMTVCMADTAQSYMAHARSSGRCSPRAFSNPLRAGTVVSGVTGEGCGWGERLPGGAQGAC